MLYPTEGALAGGALHPRILRRSVLHLRISTSIQVMHPHNQIPIKAMHPRSQIPNAPSVKV